MLGKHSLSHFEEASNAIAEITVGGLKGFSMKKKEGDCRDPLNIQTSPMSPDPHNFYAKRVIKMSAGAGSMQTGSTFTKTPRMLV